MYREINYDNEPIVDLDDLYLLDYNGIDSIELRGEYYLTWLVDKMIDTWLPYIECHQCGRGDYCKFTLPHPANPQKLKEIQCGVVSKCLETFLYSTVDKFNGYHTNQKQHYLDGLYYLHKYIIESEHYIGILLQDDFVANFGEYISGFLGSFTSLTENLNKFSFHFKTLTEFKSTKKILLVEGWSEKIFIERILTEGIIRNLSIEVYDGKNNSGYKKIHLLVNRLRRIGYSVFIQGDMDGSNIDKFQDHKMKGLFNENEIFQFSRDFESSVPPELMANCLINLCLLEESKESEFLTNIYPLKDSLVNTVRKKMNIEIERNKLDIADMVASLLLNINWWNNENFLKHELGEFMLFLKNINMFSSSSLG